MIYWIILKTYRWSVFVIYALAFLYAGLVNSPEGTTYNLPFKDFILTVFGLLIVFHFGLIFYFGQKVKEIFFQMYFDDHYTVIKGQSKMTYSAHRFMQIQHEFDDEKDVKIYYNNPEGKDSFISRIR